jgi:hypothetical protein
MQRDIKKKENRSIFYNTGSAKGKEKIEKEGLIRI